MRVRGMHDVALLRTLKDADDHVDSGSPWAHHWHSCRCSCAACKDQDHEEEAIPLELRYARWANTLDAKPFALIIDRQRREVILTIRGTMSGVDMMTDALATEEPLPAEVDGAALDDGEPRAHGGIYRVAELLRLALIEPLHAMLVGTSAECAGFALVLTGHSLGAGVAAVLALLIRTAWRGNGVDVRCVAFAPPGGTLSKGVAEACRSYTTSVWIENDLVTTLGLSQLELLRDEVLYALCFSTTSKYSLALSSLRACFCCRLPPQAKPPPLATSTLGALSIDWDAAGEPPSAAASKLLRSHRATRPHHATPLWPPGRLVRMRRGAARQSWCAQELPNADECRRIRLPLRRAALDHMPDKLLRVLQLARTQAEAAPSARFM